MKILLIITLVFFVLAFLFGNITVNGRNASSFQRLIVSALGAAFLGAVIGLPILGILKLLGL